jgi:predicted PurR-regulated permease PerM
VIRPKTALAVLVVCFAIAIWFIHDTLLLVFAGILAALVLRALAEKIARITRLPVAWSVWVAIAGTLAVAAAATALLGSAIGAQLSDLRHTLPAAFNSTLEQLRATPAGAWAVSNLPNIYALVPDTAHLLTRATGIISGALGAVAAVLIVIFVGIAAALEPQLYVNGFVQLFPAGYRSRMRAVSSEIGQTLRTWLLARLLTMSVTAILVTAGLAILHVPLAGALGMLAGALAFIPNIGAFIAAAPAVLLAFVASPKAAIAVIAMYAIVHLLDDFVVAPLVERQVVKLPPILTLMAQIVLGIGAGAVGIMLAAPIVAAVLVIVRRLWVEDVADLALADLPSISSKERSIV